MSITAEEAIQMTEKVINQIDISLFILEIDKLILNEIKRGSHRLLAKQLLSFESNQYEVDRIMDLLIKYYKDLGYFHIRFDIINCNFYFSIAWRDPNDN